LITTICYLVKSLNFEAPRYEFFSNFLLLPLSRSKRAPKQFVAKHPHFVSFLFGYKSSLYSQTERDKITLSRFNTCDQLKYLTKHSDFILILIFFTVHFDNVRILFTNKCTFC
jgi:hypothetical protein